MEQLNLKTLLVNDDDLECKKEELTLTDLGVKDLNFTLEDLKGFDLIVYIGKRGQKIIRSRYFRSGKLG